MRTYTSDSSIELSPQQVIIECDKLLADYRDRDPQSLSLCEIDNLINIWMVYRRARR